MAIKQKLTPDAFLEAPRRGPAVPSPSGRIAFFTLSTHTFGEGTKKEVMLMDIGSGKHWQLCEDDKVDSVTWLPGVSPDTLVWLRSGDMGFTEVRLAVAPGPDADGELEPHLCGVIPAPAQAMKLKELEDGSVAFAVVCLAGEDGGLYNKEMTPKPESTARIYDDLRVREWDTYRTPQKYAVFYSRLYNDYTWKLSPLSNALRDTDLEAPDNVYQLGDAADAFDIGPKGIAFISKMPILRNPIEYQCSDVYFVPIENFGQAAAYKPSQVVLQGGGFVGECTNVRFSPDGTMVAFLKASQACPTETRLHMGHVGSGAAFDVMRLVVGQEWNLNPDGFEYSPDGRALFVLAQDCGRNALFKLDLQHKAKPTPLTTQGSVSAYHPVHCEVEGERDGKDMLLVSGSSLTESSWYQMVDLDMAFEPRVVSTASKHGAKFGLSHAKQVSEIYFEGAGDYCVQAWVVKPSDFDEDKKYPVVLMIHGGPAGATKDEWHMRWNGVVWAEQGYVVVMPNISGSTGFGRDHAKRINGSWGGYPYDELVNCMEYVKNIPYIDANRAIAAGGSYGGYMVNWINGHTLGQQFKAMVCHDSVFSTETMDLMSDEFSGIAEFNGPAFTWKNYEETHKWNPARPDLLKNWKKAAPTLVIHSDKDYRCPVTDGIAVFKALQFMRVPSRLLTFPDENHFVLKPENSREWHRVVFEWINKYSGVAAEQATEPAVEPAVEPATEQVTSEGESSGDLLTF